MARLCFINMLYHYLLFRKVNFLIIKATIREEIMIAPILIGLFHCIIFTAFVQIETVGET